MSGKETPRMGWLVLVVGASGAGKDTLIDEARRQLAGDSRFVFPTRIITRPKDAGGEIHQAMSEEGFAKAEAAGQFSFVWRAHGFAYAIPKSVDEDLAVGKVVVINVSRSVIAAARRRFSKLKVLLIEAPEIVRAERIATRGRETLAEAKERLARAGRFTVTGDDVIVIDNGGELAPAAGAFVAALREY
jgi:ribose 1,5-bisphosphokinase